MSKPAKPKSMYAPTPPPAAPYRWTCATEQAAFAPRDGAGALTFQGKMWLLGGWNPGDKVHFPNICNSEVWSSTDGVSWTLEVKAAPWEGRHVSGYVVFKDRMWIVGGDANQGHYQTDVWSSPDGRCWERETDSVPWAPRVFYHTVVHDGKIWVIGGQTLPQFAPATEIFFNDVWSSTDGKTWTRVLEHAPWSPRGLIFGTAVFKSRIWLLGGGTYATPAHPDRQFLVDVWSTAAGAEWKRHADAPWQPRQMQDVAVFDDRLWVLEGWHPNGGNRKDVWYSADGETWRELPGTPWLPRHGASVFVHAGALWMVAGNNMTSDAWRLDRAPGANGTRLGKASP